MTSLVRRTVWFILGFTTVVLMSACAASNEDGQAATEPRVEGPVIDPAVGSPDCTDVFLAANGLGADWQGADEINDTQLDAYSETLANFYRLYAPDFSPPNEFDPSDMAGINFVLDGTCPDDQHPPHEYQPPEGE